jgi:glutaconate CoA-transferase subunit B
MVMSIGRRELMACQLADRLRDGELVVIGGASVIPMAAALLAQATHAPNLTLLTGSGAVNPRPTRLEPSGGDAEYLRTAEAHFTIEDVFDDCERGRYDVSIFGGIQVDQYANFNLTFVGGTLGRPRFRGPGFVNAGIANAAGRFMLCCEAHTPRTLVERVDFASGAGARCPGGAPYPDDRPGGGPDHCVTPLCCLRVGSDGRLGLASLHPGVTLDAVRVRTGFGLGGGREVPVTPVPPAEQLAVLRERVDRAGVLRAEVAV